MGDGKKPSLGILYLGHDSGTSRHRADALRRLRHNVDVLDPWEFFPASRISRKFLKKLTIEAVQRCSNRMCEGS